jgi:hypothetical protein
LGYEDSPIVGFSRENPKGRGFIGSRCCRFSVGDGWVGSDLAASAGASHRQAFRGEPSERSEPPERKRRRRLRCNASGPIGGDRAHRIINAYSVAFFDRHLNGEPRVLLDGPGDKYPEVIFETRRPYSPHPRAGVK